MPDARLQRTRDNYICEMCGYDTLVGSHTRTVDVRGSVIERCPKRYMGMFMPAPYYPPTSQRTGDESV